MTYNAKNQVVIKYNFAQSRIKKLMDEEEKKPEEEQNVNELTKQCTEIEESFFTDVTEYNEGNEEEVKEAHYFYTHVEDFPLQFYNI